MLAVLLVETSDRLDRLRLEPEVPEERELAVWVETLEKLDIVLPVSPTVLLELL